MKYFLKGNWWWILFAVISATFICLMIKTTEYKNVNGVIIEHVVTSDRYGNATYHSIVKSEDGYTDEVLGIGTYSMPIGTRINYRIERIHPIHLKFK